MNFFHKNKYIVWVLIILFVINLAALASFFIFAKTTPPASCCPDNPGKGHSFVGDLGLSPDQAKKVAQINQNYKALAEPISAAIKKTRGAILGELEQDFPDTSLLNTLSQELSLLQKQIQKENIKQYLALKDVCDQEQAQRLSAIYRDLYGCPMQAKGIQHKNRHGQDKNQRNSQCE